MAWSVRGEKRLALNNAELVFVGFGINAPEYGWNDYEGIDVKGKIVVALVNDPGYYDDRLFRGKYMTYYGRWIYKFEEASRQGAAGVLVIHDTKPASYGFDVVQNSWGNVNLSLFSETRNRELVALQGWVSNDGARRLFIAAGVDFDSAVSKAKLQGFKAIPLPAKASATLVSDVRIAESSNVAAVLPGTERPDEYSPDWDVAGTLDDVNLWFSLGLQVADGVIVPQWTGNKAYKTIRESQR